MPFDLRPAAAADAPAITAVFLAAFSDPFNQRIFPPTPDVTAYWHKQFAQMSANPAQRVLKIVDTDTDTDAEAVVAFAVWGLPCQPQQQQQQRNPHAEPEPDPAPAPELDSYPASSDADLCRLFFGGMQKMHEEIMRGKPHYYLNMLGTHPAYHGRGLASRLLRWGLERADAEGVETYLSASRAGRPLYEKYGFRVVEVREVAAGYVQWYMVREPGGSQVGGS
ncbi:GNAT family N-acetyltransferase [Aspergillus clavatus NRRL 1]|uniref:Acetyltransferase, GNAT family family n=1 Tax=Aspergillus clavatus (strain ATCC 1007 / CBS 513.65 / DSM 816 / NCTC 3887 / NRRL 1 / QM 1276 / 107) TaxID=344612 RepID=A1C4A9_ASPCL|nr:acetyltransferase, GNAT family [Aspergillus clavatus NRRL 1]EAW15249.1 acetyltransferase, GNAT family family [Aspergillus clavatus NRRL 1]